MTSINFWPVLIASIVAFALSAFWYSPILFGKEWMRLAKISDKDVSSSEERGMWKLYLAQFIITIVMFCVMGFLVSSMSSRSAGDGAFLAFLLWIGFSATKAIGEMLWQKVPLKLALITELANLITWTVGGAIIGAWK